jgi:hypothetical protein
MTAATTAAFAMGMTAFCIGMAAAATTVASVSVGVVAVPMPTATATGAVAMVMLVGMTVSMSAALIATPVASTFARGAPLAAARTGVGTDSHQLATLVLGDRFADGRRRGAVNRYSLPDQGAQRNAVDTAAQHGVDLDVLPSSRTLLAQAYRLERPGFGVEKHQMLGIWQMRLDRRIETRGGRNGNTQLH